MKTWWRDHRPGLLGWLIAAGVRALGATLRLRTIGREEVDQMPGGKILVLWHGRTAVASQMYKGKGIWVIISQSRDGEIQDRIFKKLGYKSIRGSTGRGGERALIEAIRCLREGNTMAITPDGPKGPSGVVHPGVLVMAKKSGTPLIPLGVSASPRYLFKSWDRHMLPAPFAKCCVMFGEPITVPKDANEEQLKEIGEQLRCAMDTLERAADVYVGVKP